MYKLLDQINSDQVKLISQHQELLFAKNEFETILPLIEALELKEKINKEKEMLDICKTELEKIEKLKIDHYKEINSFSDFFINSNKLLLKMTKPPMLDLFMMNANSQDWLLLHQQSSNEFMNNTTYLEIFIMIETCLRPPAPLKFIVPDSHSAYKPVVQVQIVQKRDSTNQSSPIIQHNRHNAPALSPPIIQHNRHNPPALSPPIIQHSRHNATSLSPPIIQQNRHNPPTNFPLQTHHIVPIPIPVYVSPVTNSTDLLKDAYPVFMQQIQEGKSHSNSDNLKFQATNGIQPLESLNHKAPILFMTNTTLIDENNLKQTRKFR
jgi:hypothetical protein